jgi:hypothetical protein
MNAQRIIIWGNYKFPTFIKLNAKSLEKSLPLNSSRNLRYYHLAIAQKDPEANMGKVLKNQATKHKYSPISVEDIPPGRLNDTQN